MSDLNLKSVEKHIGSQMKYWENNSSLMKKEDLVKDGILPFVTISREYGCGGYDVALAVSKIFNEEYSANPLWVPYDKRVLKFVMEDLGLSEKLANSLTYTAHADLAEFARSAFSRIPSQNAVFLKMAETIRNLCIHGNVIIVGRGGNFLTYKLPKGFHVRLIAPVEWRVGRIAELHNLSRKDAFKEIKKNTKERDRYLNKFIRMTKSLPKYHLIINNSEYSCENAARLIVNAMELKGLIIKKNQ